MSSGEIIVLNRSYMPIGKISLERGIILIILNKAFSIKDSDKVVRSVNIEVKVPEVLVLKDVNYISWKKTPYTRKAAFKHYGKCQMCDESDRTKLTLEHLIPRSRWNKISKERDLEYSLNSWDNCIILCKKHNQEKSDSLPEEIGWDLKITEPLYEFTLDWTELYDLGTTSK